MLDAFEIFTAFCLLVPPLKSMSPALAAEYFADPALLGAAALYFLVRWWGKPEEAEFAAPWERRAANWYLLNGVVFHALMDFGVGVKHQLPLMDAAYQELDRRFVTGDPVPVVVGTTEMFVMAPLCFLTYRAVLHNLPGRNALELVTGAFQFFGMVVFVGAELADGLSNVPVDYNFDFSHYHCLNFWFGFVLANLVWTVVPLRLMWLAYERSVAADSSAEEEDDKED